MIKYDGAIVLLAAGSDVVLKHIVDEYIYFNREYDFENLKNLFINVW